MSLEYAFGSIGAGGDAMHATRTLRKSIEASAVIFGQNAAVLHNNEIVEPAPYDCMY